MKYKTIFLILLFFIPSLHAESGWKCVNDNPPNDAVYSTCLINNTVYFWCSHNIVYRTKDGGKTFETFLPYAPTENTALDCCAQHGISFADSMTGYITDIAHGEFQTLDGGKTWIKRANPGSASELVDFASSTIGWKVGPGFYKTENGGKTWKSIYVPFWEGGIYSNIFSLDEEHVWILKSYYNGRKPEGSIWYSSNGGTKWERLNTGLSSSDSIHVEYYNLRMRPDGYGVAIGKLHKTNTNQDKAFIQRTTDFGKTWTTLELKKMRLHTILSINDSTWVILGNIGSYQSSKIIQLRSSDSAKTWEESYPLLPKYNSYNNYFDAAEYIPEFNCILAATIQGIYKSVDYGKSYFPITTKRDIYAKEVNIERNPRDPASQIIILRSFNRTYLLSLDSGRSWHKREIPKKLGGEISHVKIANGAIFMVVDQDKLYKSLDIGETWVHINPYGYRVGLLGLDALNENVLCIYNYPYFCTTFDGGNHWISTPSPDLFWPLDSYMLSPNEISMMGIDLTDYSNQKGFFYHTSDNGYNWYIQPADHPLKQFTFISKKIGYAISKYRIYTTNDSGYSWHEILKTDKNVGTFSGICFFDSLQGLVHSGKTFLETKDGGKTWQKVPWKFQYEFINQLAVDKNGDVFAVSNGSLFYYPHYFSPNPAPLTNRSNAPKLNVKNFPNPFNNRTKIVFSLPESEMVTIKIFNSSGQQVKKLLRDILPKGTHQIYWDGTNNSGLMLPSGVYFLQISANKHFIASRKLLLIK